MDLPYINLDALSPTEPLLVSWGGGIDSTFTIKWLLENTQNPIYADHWSIISDRLSDHRANAERFACEQLYPELSKIRPFEYKSFNAEWINCWARGPAVISLAQQSAQRRRIKKMIIGVSIDDVNQKLPNTDLLAIGQLIQFGDKIATAWEEMQSYLDVKLEHTQYCRFALLPEDVIGKKYSYGIWLGKELVEMTFSCTNSVWLEANESHCGHCPRCIARAEILTELN